MKMKNIVSLLALLLAVQGSCSSSAGTVPTGAWEYDLLVNGVRVGEASVSNKISDGKYLFSTRMTMQVGQVKNVTEQLIVETLDFKPLKYEVISRIITGDKVQEMTTRAVFSGRTVELQTGQTKSRIELKKDFIIDGNFFIDRLMKAKFKAGEEIRGLIYEPMIETEDPIPVALKVLGTVKVKIRDKERELIHVAEAIENFKNIDLYINERGITEKAVIYMLNNRFELEKK